MASLIITEAEGLSAKELACWNSELQEILDWFRRNAPKAKWSIGFVFELASHALGWGYNTFAILDEIGAIERPSTNPCVTKPAAVFQKPPLKGLWHKHHAQARFMMENIRLELTRPGAMEAIFEPYLGKTVADVVNEFVHDMVVDSYSKRAQDKRITGEFIVFEKLPDGRNYYITLGSHGEYQDIASRVEIYRQMDLANGNL
jgi:hypothetical protein